MALKILLADPDRAFTDACSLLLKQSGFIVKQSENGKDAQIIISQHGLYALAIAGEIQNHSIGQVLKFARGKGIKQILVYTKSAESLKAMEMEAESFMKLGANEFLADRPAPEKLFSMLEGGQSVADMIDNLKKREGVSAEEEVNLNDDKFTPINIADFYSSKNVLFDVYIRLGQGKYLKILHTGDAFSKERLDRYKNEKKVEKLYISTLDRKKFVQWNTFVLEKTIASATVPTENKVKLMRAVSDKYMEEVFMEGLKPQLVEQGKALCNSTFNLIEKEKNLYKVLRGYQDLDPTAYSHFFLIGLFCGMVVRQFEWQSQNTTDTLTMAAMLHDVGKAGLPKVLITLRPKDMTPEQFEQYKRHPQLSIEMMEGTRLFNNAIKQVILQHHEAADGSGFPFGLKDSNLSALSKILFFVNDFVDMITEKKIGPVQGVIELLKDQENFKRFNPLVVENFTKIFVDPDKIQKSHALPSNSTMVPTKKAQ